MNDRFSPTVRKRTPAEAGFNLVEVLIGMALLGAVVVTIVGLFFAGTRNVYSGKQMTQAVSVGTRAMEDLTSLDRNALYSAFAIVTTGTPTPLGPVTIDTGNGANLPGNTYQNSVLRSTRNTAQQDTEKQFLSRWRQELDTYNKLANADVFVVITPTLPATVAEASVIRVRVIVRWNEGMRRRQAVFDTVRYQR